MAAEEVPLARARRVFLKAVAIAPLTPGALLASPAGQPAPPTAAPAPAPGASGVADALAEAVRLEHGAQLDAEGLARVRKEIASSLDAAARLRRAARLTNADEPATLFAATPPQAAGPGEGRR